MRAKKGHPRRGVSQQTRWQPQPFFRCRTGWVDLPSVEAREELGGIAHGPALLAAVDRITVGLRCVFAHPSGLHLPVMLVARGEPADVAQRRQTERLRHGLRLEVSSGEAGPTRLSAFSTAGEGNVGYYRQESEFWLAGLPDRRAVTLTVSWPEIGLAATAVVLQFPDLAARAETSIPLS